MNMNIIKKVVVPVGVIAVGVICAKKVVTKFNESKAESEMEIETEDGVIVEEVESDKMKTVKNTVLPWVGYGVVLAGTIGFAAYFLSPTGMNRAYEKHRAAHKEEDDAMFDGLMNNMIQAATDYLESKTPEELEALDKLVAEEMSKQEV